MSLTYIREYYGVPAEVGRRITLQGRPGVIVAASGPHLSVIFEGDQGARPVHPTWEVEYGALTEQLPLKKWRCLAPWHDPKSAPEAAWFEVFATTRNLARKQAFIELLDVGIERAGYIRITVRRA